MNDNKATRILAISRTKKSTKQNNPTTSMTNFPCADQESVVFLVRIFSLRLIPTTPEPPTPMTPAVGSPKGSLFSVGCEELMTSCVIILGLFLVIFIITI